jgi:hypothetical protein
LKAFDTIDLMSLQSAAAVDAAVKRISRVQAMAERIRLELRQRLPSKAVTKLTRVDPRREDQTPFRNKTHGVGKGRASAA